MQGCDLAETRNGNPMSTNLTSESLAVRDIRELRHVADILLTSADQSRSMLVEQLGLKRYIFNTLGSVAHNPATGCRLLWSDNAELVSNVEVPLGEYLFQKAQASPRCIAGRDGRAARYRIHGGTQVTSLAPRSGVEPACWQTGTRHGGL
jgi:hypothetical protein